MDDEYRIEVTVSIPRDSDGFIRRQCPHCVAQFKWHDGPANEESERHAAPENYTCPICGQAAETDSWLTDEQLELVQQKVLPQAMERIQDDIEAAFTGTKGVTYKRGNDVFPDSSTPLTEPDDMMIVASPCHSYEPVKVPENHTGRLFCLVCGAAFAV